MQIKIYDDQQAHAMATQFFGHDYQDPGVMKWGGFLLSEHTACLQAQPRLPAQKNRHPKPPGLVMTVGKGY